MTVFLPFSTSLRLALMLAICGFAAAGHDLCAAELEPTPASADQAKPVVAKPKMPIIRDQLVIDWIVAASRIERISGTFTRYTYNHRFQRDYRATGTFYFEGTEGIYQSQPKQVESGTTGRSKNQFGKPCEPYQVKSEEAAERWFFLGSELVRIDDSIKNVASTRLPFWGRSTIESPLSIMNSANLRHKFEIHLLGHDREHGTFLVKLSPKRSTDIFGDYLAVFVILDDISFLPRAMRLVEHGETHEVVHVFQNVRVNNAAKIGKLARLGPDYRQILADGQQSSELSMGWWSSRSFKLPTKKDVFWEVTPVD